MKSEKFPPEACQTRKFFFVPGYDFKDDVLKHPEYLKKFMRWGKSPVKAVLSLNSYLMYER